MPTNPGALYDLLQERFGIGSYDESIDKRPWFKVRMTEVAKVTALLRRRGVTIQEVVLAADYAKKHRKPITAAWQVFDLVPEALRAAKKRGPNEVREQLTAAAAEAMAMGRDDWSQRLYMADIHSGPNVLDLWQKTKESL